MVTVPYWNVLKIRYFSENVCCVLCETTYQLGENERKKIEKFYACFSANNQPAFKIFGKFGNFSIFVKVIRDKLVKNERILISIRFQNKYNMWRHPWRSEWRRKFGFGFRMVCLGMSSVPGQQSWVWTSVFRYIQFSKNLLVWKNGNSLLFNWEPRKLLIAGSLIKPAISLQLLGVRQVLIRSVGMRTL